MKRYLLAAFFFIGIFLPVLAQSGSSATEMLLKANKLYEDGQFSAAAESYEQLAGMGMQNSIVFYNLGNAYFKNGDLGRAILNYRRAARRAPRDADIRANLALARSKTEDNIQGSSASIPAQLAAFSEHWVTTNELAIGSLALWVLLAALIIAITQLYHPLAQQILRYSIAVIAVLFIGGTAMFASRIIITRTQPAAIIVSAAVDITSGPGDQYVTEFTLHSGTEVTLIETRGKWVRLALPGNQLQGWAPAGAVEAVAN